MRLPNDPIGLNWQPVTTADLAELVSLLNAIADIDSLPERFDLETLTDELAEPHLDLERDTLLGRDHDGAILAFSVVTELPGTRLRRVQLWGGVAPVARQRGVGTALLSRQREQAKVLLETNARGFPELLTRPVLVSVDYREGDASREKLVTAMGFTSIRRFYEMERPLGEPHAQAQHVGTGLAIRRWEPADDETVRTLHNDAFAEHFFSEPRSPQTWRSWTTEHRSFRRDWSFVAEKDGDIVGYLAGHAHEVDWDALGYRQGWINVVGVRQDCRGLGIASGLLEASCSAMSTSGMASAGLEVDTHNTSGALATYTNLGFAPKNCFVKAVLG